MMYVCQACKGETYSRSNRMKPSSCSDCFAENPIVNDNPMSCACHDVGHDKDKIPRIRPMSKSLEDQIKSLVGDVREIERDRSGDAKV